MNWIAFNYLTTAILLLLPACVADDQLVPGKPLSVGSTAISNGGAFTLGFFSPTNSTSSSLYLGIWYNDISPLTVVWVANRETPVKDGHGGSSSAPSLTLSNTSDLVLADGDGRVLWTTNITIAASSPAVAVLMNTGNLVVRSPNGTTLWQSFHHPTDTYLPGMKIGINYRTRAGEHLLSWNGPGDPSPGSFSFGGDPDTFLQLFIWNQSRPYWRSAVWTGSPIPSQLMVNGSSLMYLSVVGADDEIYLSFGISDRAPRTRYVLTNSGKLQVLTWDGGASKWNKLGEVPSECERYGGYCHYSEAAPTCECLDGFEAMSTEEWSNGQFSRGCRRTEELRCGSGSDFLALQGMQLPDKFLRVRNKTLHECAAECAGNCSCNLSSEKRDATRCLVWIGELIDTQKVGGETLYLRFAGKRKQRNAVKIAVPVLVSMLIITCICLSWFCIFSGKKGSVKKHKKAQVQAVLTATALQLEEASTTHDHEFPFVNFDDIVTATNNFSKSFMIGQGGFGKVYKGIVQGGQEVAVKRLSRDSDQGIVEFRNEVTLIAKLQHRNLVRLLESGKDAVLDWPARFKIIKEMRPKIADFGMARIFGDNQQNANTRRVVGTYGYMAPEYEMEGIFSVKTDVYSFGVLLLEVISGLKISNIDRIMDFPNLIVYAWSLWMEGKAKDMVDLNITESCILDEALLCIHVGLLCVQENPDDRPLMSSVVSLLENGSTILPTPNQPAYFAPRNNGSANQRRENVFNSRNEMTLTVTIVPGCTCTQAVTVILLFLLSLPLCASDDRLAVGKTLSPGATLVSDGGAFAMGFFSPSNSSGLYLGIWYNNVPKLTVVWVADQLAPITDHPSSSKLTMANDSNLVLSDVAGRVLWRTNVTAEVNSSSAVAVLVNSGNLVLRLPDDTALWQTFEHPSDVFMAGMKLGIDYRTNSGMRIVFWKSAGDPSPGSFSFGVDPERPLQAKIWNGSRVHWRSSMWTGYMVDSNYQKGGKSAIYTAVVYTDDEIYASFTLSVGAPPMHYLMSYSGDLHLQSWSNVSSAWVTNARFPRRDCSLFGYCGAFGYCGNSTGGAGASVSMCHCLEGFEPASGDDWSRGDFSLGCRQKEAVRCGDGFAEFPDMKLPDGYTLVGNMNSDECAAACRRNCSCVAYAYANLSSSTRRDPTRCLMWGGELLDMEKVNESWGDFGETLYLRMAGAGRGTKTSAVKFALPIVLASILIPTCILICVPKFKEMIVKYDGKNNKKRALRVLSISDEFGKEIPAQDLDFPFVEYKETATATDNFSEASMIGKGGFGKVYKGVIGGREVAIKRLSSCSEQGVVEFRNEVLLIAKLQHRNLVRLVGCSIEGDEKLLIYEFMANKSLDAYLFRVARGLLYLHQDSRLTVIHRDLKASNILLDTEMNPKISDFGMARIFGDNQQNGITRRVVGTYGYMAPEYAMGGIFSMKSDVYSFGVLLLEIVSGSRISSTDFIEDFPNLSIYAWNLWNEGKAKNMIDPSIVASCLDEVMLCIHVGLLCVQENLNDRPLMSSVMFILENGSNSLPAPNRPAYFAQRDIKMEQPRDDTLNSNNTVTLTVMEGR
uniref:non-specific serine/threonine protein kinase n=1 Tax=Oryza punctata TaxID=4537 RepID=A0A0E0LZM8_ORYPU